MKYLITLLSLFTCLQSYTQENSNYIIIIDGDSTKVSLDKEFTHKSKSGELINLKIIQPSILTYLDNMVKFEYDKSVGVSSTDLGNGIEQIMVMKPTGSGFIVQKYTNFNPSNLISLMISEITKESINYGYKKIEEPFKKELLSGHTLEGTKAVLKYKDDTQFFTVSAYGGKDEGILVVTMISNDDYEYEDQLMIDRLFKSLKILFN